MLEERGDRALLRLRLHTGRMHQIRAHLRHIGHPVVGDPRYGKALPNQRMLLHAAELIVPHPVRDKTLELHAEPGEAFR